MSYHIENTGANWPWSLPFRDSSSRVGYPTREAAATRARRVTNHAAKNGINMRLRVVARQGKTLMEVFAESGDD